MTTNDVAPRSDPRTLYPRLAAEFDSVSHDVRGGVQFDYITGEQVISRLNVLLGFGNWSFRVLEHGIDTEADEMWVLGELRVTGFAEEPVVRQQFGSQKRRRARSNGTPLDTGFDLKAAATDCLKKCATLIGIGLYLTRREEPAATGKAATNGRGTRSSNKPSQPASTGGLVRAECGVGLKETRFKDGSLWTPAMLADFGQSKSGRVLCLDHYRRALNTAPSSATPDAQRHT
jgi:hypothetical protein